MPNTKYLHTIRDLIGRGQIDRAMEQMRGLLDNSPHLDEIIQQQARFQAIRQQIRLGTVSHQDATLTQNQISAALLDLLQEIEQQSEKPLIQKELEQAAININISNSQNFVSQSPISGDVNFNNTYITYADRIIPHALTPPPFRTEVFVGREADLQNIHDRLFSPDGNLLLLVNGEGGIGKTTLAARYFFDYQHKYVHVGWVLNQTGMADAMLQLARPLALQFEDHWDARQRLEVLLSAMSDLQHPCLLVIDNANDLSDLEAGYQYLRRCSNFHLLLTTRITHFERAPVCPIGGLPPEDALALFEQYYRPLPEDERALFFQLREAVGGNTLVLELLAKNLAVQNKLRQRYSLSELLGDLQGRGLLQLGRTQTVGTDYQSKGAMRREKPEDIIAAMYDLGELPPEQTALLSVFAALPAEKIPFEHLETLLGDEASEEHLLALAQKGWLEFDESDTSFKCSPVVQEITRLKNPDWQEDCRALVTGLVQELNSEKIHEDNYLHSTVFTRYAETVIAVMNEPDDDVAILCQNIGIFHTDTGDITKALNAYQTMADILNFLFINNPDDPDFKNNLAISYSKLGETHTALGNLDQALAFFEDETKLFEELYAAYPQNVAFKNGLAISYEKLGSTHTALGNLDQALTFFEDYNKLEKELYAASPQNVAFKNGLAISYSQLGSTHTALGNLDQALTFFEDFNSLEKELYTAYPQNVAFTSNYAESLAVLFAIDRLRGNTAKNSNIETAILLFEELHETTHIIYYQKKGAICQQMKAADANIKSLIAEMSAF